MKKRAARGSEKGGLSGAPDDVAAIHVNRSFRADVVKARVAKKENPRSGDLPVHDGQRGKTEGQRQTVAAPHGAISARQALVFKKPDPAVPSREDENGGSRHTRVASRS